jgi:hypothetical protein
MWTTYGKKFAHFHTTATDLQCILGNFFPDLPELEVDIGLGYEEPEVWKAPDAGVNPLQVQQQLWLSPRPSLQR